MIAEAHRAAADLLNADADEVVFGPNATTLLFAISRSVGRTLGPGDEVVVTRLDHDANVRPWVLAAEDAGATVRWVDIREDDVTLDLASFEAALSERTKIVAFTLASNAVGHDHPRGRARPARARAHAGDRRVRRRPPRAAPPDRRPCDRRRPGGVLPLQDLRPAPRDPVRAPRGALLAPPLQGPAGRGRAPRSRSRPGRRTTRASRAGSPRSSTSPSSARARSAGGRRRRRVRAGDRRRRRGRALAIASSTGSAASPPVRLYGIADPSRVGERTPTFAIRVGDQHPAETAKTLAERGIFVWDGTTTRSRSWSGSGCRSSGGAVRIGFCHYNTPDEVDRVLEELATLA